MASTIATPRSTEDKPSSARNHRRRARTRAAVLDAAQVIFRRDGYQDTRMEDIAEYADVSVGTLYVHFTGKRTLYAALADRALELFASYMTASEDPQLGALQQVLAGGDAYLRFYLDHPELFLLLTGPSVTRSQPADPALDVEPANRVGADTVEEIEHQIATRTRALLDRFANRIDAAIAAGEATPVDSRVLTHYLWGAWNGVIALRHQQHGPRLNVEQVTETLQLAQRLLRDALTPRPAAQPR